MLSPLSLGESVRDQTRLLAEELGCTSNDSANIKACLKEATVEELLAAHERLGHANAGFTFKWQPRIDGHFFPKDIPQLLREAPPLPCLMGHTKEEYVSFCEFTTGSRYCASVLGFVEAVHSLTISPDVLSSFDRDAFVDKLQHCHFTEYDFGPRAEEMAKRIANFYLRHEPKKASPEYYLGLEERVSC